MLAAEPPTPPRHEKEEEGNDTEALLAGCQHNGDASNGPGRARWRYAGTAILVAVLAATPIALFVFHGLGRSGTGSPEKGRTANLQAKVALAADDPMWGCGLLGLLPGITQNGQTTPETQRLIDALKFSSSFNKVTFWNWNLAPQKLKNGVEHLSADFLFMPEMWGAGVVEEKYVRPAGVANFLDSTGQPCPAEMATLFLGMNEPDIRGSCMGNMFGKCSAPCDKASVAAQDCPAAHLGADLPRAFPNSKGQCNCWQFSHATGVGFWPLAGCQGDQPLMKVWDDPVCSSVVMKNWKATATIAYNRGYKYLSTPLVAVDIGYAEKFIEKACGCTVGQCACTDASCGCPVYIGFHFYGYDCRPEMGDYTNFHERLQKVARIMERYTFVKGAIINEVGMLNCASVDENPICVPDGGKNPASKDPNHSCPNNGLATFIDKLFDYVIQLKTADGRLVVKGFSWFNENMAGGTYNLRLFNDDGTVNAVGESYMRNCKRWGTSWRAPAPAGTGQAPGWL